MATPATARDKALTALYIALWFIANGALGAAAVAVGGGVKPVPYRHSEGRHGGGRGREIRVKAKEAVSGWYTTR